MWCDVCHSGWRLKYLQVVKARVSLKSVVSFTSLSGTDVPASLFCVIYSRPLHASRGVGRRPVGSGEYKIRSLLYCCVFAVHAIAMAGARGAKPGGTVQAQMFVPEYMDKCLCRNRWIVQMCECRLRLDRDSPASQR